MVHETIELWGRGEYRGEVGDGFAPSIETYVLDGGQRRGAVLICPGGGYGYLSPREAEPVALQFNAAGYHAFILSYSVAPRRYPLSLLDASKAICLLRSRADAWKIHPGRIALCGFSAGAHLAASLGVYWDKPVTQEAAPTATSAAPGAASAAATEAAPGAASAAAPGKPEAAPTAPGGRARGIKGLEPGYNRPDALILSYPVITSGPFAHRGSFENLLGSDPSAELLEEVSLELHVSEKTPPTFLWHTYADEAVPLENSLLFAGALRAHGVPFELHVYPEGSHGLSLATEETSDDRHDPNPHASSWMYLCTEWLGELFGE